MSAPPAPPAPPAPRGRDAGQPAPSRSAPRRIGAPPPRAAPRGPLRGPPPRAAPRRGPPSRATPAKSAGQGSSGGPPGKAAASPRVRAAHATASAGAGAGASAGGGRSGPACTAPAATTSDGAAGAGSRASSATGASNTPSQRTRGIGGAGSGPGEAPQTMEAALQAVSRVFTAARLATRGGKPTLVPADLSLEECGFTPITTIECDRVTASVNADGLWPDGPDAPGVFMRVGFAGDSPLLVTGGLNHVLVELAIPPSPATASFKPGQQRLATVLLELGTAYTMHKFFNYGVHIRDTTITPTGLDTQTVTTRTTTVALKTGSPKPIVVKRKHASAALVVDVSKPGRVLVPLDIAVPALPMGDFHWSMPKLTVAEHRIHQDVVIESRTQITVKASGTFSANESVGTCVVVPAPRMELLKKLRVHRSPVLGGARPASQRGTGLINPQWIVRKRYELKLSRGEFIPVQLAYRPAVGVGDVLGGNLLPLVTVTAPRGCGIAPGMAIYVGISQTVDHLMNIAKPDKYAPFRHKAALTTIHCPCDDVVIASTIAEFQAAGREVKAEAHLDLASLPRDEMFGLIPTTPATSRSAAVNAGLLMFVQHKLRVFLVAMPERVKGQLSDAAPGELQFAPRSLRLMDTSEHEGRLESEFYFLNDRTEGKAPRTGPIPRATPPTEPFGACFYDVFVIDAPGEARCPLRPMLVPSGGPQRMLFNALGRGLYEQALASLQQLQLQPDAYTVPVSTGTKVAAMLLTPLFGIGYCISRRAQQAARATAAEAVSRAVAAHVRAKCPEALLDGQAEWTVETFGDQTRCCGASSLPLRLVLLVIVRPRVHARVQASSNPMHGAR